MDKLLGTLKAHTSGMTAAVMVYLACNADGTISNDDKQLIVAALLAAFGLTYVVPNKK